MVDFDNETTIGTPAIDVQRISILQRRYDLFEAIEDYKKNIYLNVGYRDNIVRARLMTFFLEIEPMLKRRWSSEDDKKDYDKIHDICMGKDKPDENQIFSAVFKLNSFLDEIRLTRIDNRKQYDPTDMEAENELKGY